MSRKQFEIPITRQMATDPVGARARLDALLADPELTAVARNQLQIYRQQLGGESKQVDSSERINMLLSALDSIADVPNNKQQRNNIVVELIQLGWSSKPTVVEPEAIEVNDGPVDISVIEVKPKRVRKKKAAK
jgi:hypothetical protein